MYRSVTESEQGRNDKRRMVSLLEGIAIGVVVAAVLFLTFV